MNTPAIFSNTTPPFDADLARAAQRGDKRAFVEIVARHQAMVCGVALGMTHDFANALMPTIHSALINGSTGQMGKVWAWLKEQPANPSLNALQEILLRSAGREDQALALRMAAEVPAGASGDKMLTQLAKSVIDHSTTADSLKDLLKNLPGACTPSSSVPPSSIREPSPVPLSGWPGWQNCPRKHKPGLRRSLAEPGPGTILLPLCNGLANSTIPVSGTKSSARSAPSGCGAVQPEAAQAALNSLPVPAEKRAALQKLLKRPP